MNTLNQIVDDFRRTEDGKIIQGASHTSRVLNHKYRNRVIIDAYTKLQKVDFWFDAIACSGSSGLLVVPQIAELLKKNIIIIRKNITDGYSDFMVEGASTHQYIIIDDLICSGNTVKRIINNIKIEIPRSKCMGVYSYMKDECAYRDRPDLCMRDLRVPYLNM
jgi:adenine/guanine phosphoribosyltransferase-like PRPP-binding protein